MNARFGGAGKALLATMMGLGIGVGACVGVAHAAPVKPRFLIVVQGVEESDGVKSEILPELRRLFEDELTKYPELVFHMPEGMPDDPKAHATEFRDGMRKNGITRAFALTLRVLEVSRDLDPPPPGKPFRILKRGIHLSIVGAGLPEPTIAIGGEGDSTVAVEIRKNEEEVKEAHSVLLEAAKTAVAQAVDMTVTKLKLPPPKDEKAKKKK